MMVLVSEPFEELRPNFSFYGDEIFRTSNIRSISQSEPHGCLGDLGWYVFA